MTAPAPPLIAAARRLVEIHEANSPTPPPNARLIADAILKVARALLAALPVVEAARDILRLFAMGPLDLAAHYGPDVDFDALSTEAALKLQAAFAAFDKITKELPR